MNNFQQAPETRTFKVKRFLIECKRVLKVTKKPDAEEFKGIVKISGLGILAIGFLGFLINLIVDFITK